MSWMSKLYETYQEAQRLALPADDKLLPVSHTQQNAHINIVIDSKGNFKRASVEKMSIVLPATETSAGRTSGEAPHPLADKLQYIAKDYQEYGGKKKPYFYSYESLLKSWCDSSFWHAKAEAVYLYIKNGRVIEDLIHAKIVMVDKNNKLLTQWTPESSEVTPLPWLVKVLPKTKAQFDQGSALVCWTVEEDGDPNSDTWQDTSLQSSWIAFDESSASQKEGFCYVNGDKNVLATNHPAKLRHTGDKAKLISANDSNGFTYRGKFLNDEEAVGISLDVTQKAHNALRWLLSRQGYRNGDQRIVAWAISGKSIPNPLIDSFSFIDYDDDLEDATDKNISETATRLSHEVDIGQSFALKLNKKMSGYREELDDYESIVIMAMDSATPGRMGITYYRECMAKEFIDSLESWHIDSSWEQRVRRSTGKKTKFEIIWPISTPSLPAVIETAYGKAVTDSLKKNLYERLLPCVLEGQSIPIDILNACVHRASNRNSGQSWEWERNLGVTCALYRGFYRRHTMKTKRRNYSMSLEINNVSRDYLYGRLLAIAERIEKVALSITNEKRITTAERLMQRFADRPYSTWRNIELALKPYMQRLQSRRGGFLVNRLKELDDIMSAFKTDEFTCDKKLSGEFLLAYHCQRQQSRPQSSNENVEENE